MVELLAGRIVSRIVYIISGKNQALQKQSGKSAGKPPEQNGGKKTVGGTSKDKM